MGKGRPVDILGSEKPFWEHMPVRLTKNCIYSHEVVFLSEKKGG